MTNLPTDLDLARDARDIALREYQRPCFYEQNYHENEHIRFARWIEWRKSLLPELELAIKNVRRLEKGTL